MFQKIISFFMSVYMFILGLLGLGAKNPVSSDKLSVVELTANPSTGYVWDYVIKDESIVHLTERTYGEQKQGVTGAPVQEYFSFEGLKEGTTVVTFRYSRPWENRIPAQTLTYTFTVDADKNITCELTESKKA